MSDNLPLIPEKGSLCTDVQPILRAVFRELEYQTPLTSELPAPVASDHLPGALGANADRWIEEYKLDCKELWRREGELKREHARRIARDPLPNIYKLNSPRPPPPAPPAPPRDLDRGLIVRTDLVPTIQQTGGCEGLWVRNILTRSSCSVSSVEMERHPAPRLPHYDDADTQQSLSVGAVEARPLLVTPAPPPPLPPPGYILCVPPQLDFVNFTIGQLHTQSLRLVNVSKFEIRLSVRPPERRELDVQLCGSRGLTVTSGAAAELRVHFRPTDVRAVRDELLIRVSMGRNFLVPIACYMQPPLLDILIPSVTSSMLSCTPGEVRACSPQEDCDVLELGARLLGDVHCSRVLLHCSADHAAFFMLTDDSWLSFDLNCLSTRGSVVAGPFVVWPAWWGGGGAVRGCAWCRAPHAGLHAAALRVLTSTAVARPLHVLADALLFRIDHLTILAQEKEYDICGDGEPACEYFVQLGTAFPHRSLSATVQLVNHSSVLYSYYWSVRPWGACSCWEDEHAARGTAAGAEELCVGAQEARAMAQQSPEYYEQRSEAARAVRVEPARGQLLPRSSCALHVHVPDVGAHLGVQRAVLMLILKDIPKESFPPDYEPMIVSEKVVTTEPIPGVESTEHEVCELVCAQMEVWWDVVPVRFVLNPPVLPLYHSRRVESVMVNITATQLFGCEGAPVTWRVPARVPPPDALRLTPAHTCSTSLCYPLPSMPNHFPETDVIAMVVANEEWQATCSVERACATRHPALRPARALLGVVPPGARMHTVFQLRNDTYQHICWWAEAFRWWGENEPSPACVGRGACDVCHELACSCALLRPTRGALSLHDTVDIAYHVNAPTSDGCVATLVRVRRTAGDVALVPGAAGSDARAVLVAYRVLAPRVVLRVLPCAAHAPHTGDHDQHCLGSACALDAGALGSRRGTATLRPRAPLTLGRTTCYRLRATNLTPLPTAVRFHKQTDSVDVLKVKFSPNEFRLRPYGQIEIRVMVEARRVCGRRLFVCRATVLRAHRPLYLLVDTAVDGVRVSCEVPLGAELPARSFVVMPRTQKEKFPWEEGRPKPSTPDEVFAEEDRKRNAIRESRCRCSFQMLYIPPEKRPAPPLPPEEQSPIEIVWTPPSLTRVCACAGCARPLVPELPEPACLQFIGVPLRTDQWAGDVHAAGVVLECTPRAGVLAAHAHVLVHVRVYADCWGLYHDQLLLQIENVEPIVLDVWVEVAGPPLQLAICPAQRAHLPPTMWLSTSEPKRALRVTNASRAHLTVHLYTARAHERRQDELPFRLYLRYVDVPPRACPCLAAGRPELAGEQTDSCSLVEEVDTGFEIYLAADYGVQSDDYYTVEPAERELRAGDSAAWSMQLAPPRAAQCAPDHHLLLRLTPAPRAGPGWYRPEPPPQVVRLRHAVRQPCLKLSCRELRVHLCALDLPYGDVLRVRKRFHVMNVGSAMLELGMETSAPWCVLHEQEERGGAHHCGADCCCAPRLAARLTTAPLRLEPASSIEACVEVTVNAAEAWAGAAATPQYPPRTTTTTPLHIYDEDNVLQTVSLVLELEFPVLRVTPPLLDFGVVADGDTRKMYFSVSHSSRSVTLDIATHWVGGNEFKIWPPFLRIPPGGSANVYLQYTAVWRAAPSEGYVRVSVRCAGEAGGGAGEAAGPAGWCRAAVAVRAAPALDHKFHATRHDHTDDTRLLPPDLFTHSTTSLQ